MFEQYKSTRFLPVTQTAINTSGTAPHATAPVRQWGSHTRGQDVQFSDNMNVQSQLGRHQQPKLTVAKEPLKKNGKASFPSKAIAECKGATSGCLGMNHVIVLKSWAHTQLPFPATPTCSQGCCPIDLSYQSHLCWCMSVPVREENKGWSENKQNL